MAVKTRLFKSNTLVVSLERLSWNLCSLRVWVRIPAEAYFIVYVTT